jgi:MFS family permease
MLSSSLQSITHDLHLGTAAETQTIFSIYVLSWGTGPLLLGPLSEVYGRVLVLQLSTIVFVAFSIASGLSRSSAELIIFRFISGLGGSAVLAVSYLDLSHPFLHTDSILGR